MKNPTFKEGGVGEHSQKNNKMEAWTVYWFKEGLGKKEGGGVFEWGLRLQSTLWFLWSKYIMCELKKSTEELRLLALKIEAKFEGEMTCAFKNDMKNLANLHKLK